MKLILPILLAVLGVAGGLVGGHMAKPPPEETPEEATAAAAETADGTGAETGAEGDAEGGAKMAQEPKLAGYAAPKPAEKDMGPSEFVKLDRQFVVPVVEGDRVVSMMVLSMALEVDAGARETVFAHEPKLRDALLQALFAHAQSGGFSGVFTQRHLMDDLRRSMTAAVRDVLGPSVHGVLLTNVLRQDQ